MTEKIEVVNYTTATMEINRRLKKIAKHFQEIQKIQEEHGVGFLQVQKTLDDGRIMNVDTGPSVWLSSSYTC